MGDDLAPTRARLIRAVVLAPLAAPAAYAAGLLAVTLVASLGPGPGPVGRLLNIPLAVGAIGTPVAYGAMLAGGVPVYLILRRLGLVARWSLWLGGAVIGAVTAVLLAPALRGDLFSIPFPWWAGTLLGVVSAETFWRLLAAPRRPRRPPD